MDLNATLLVQMLCFIVFIVVTMKWIWPPIISALEERRQKIADGLAAAEQGQKDLELAQIKQQEMLNEAKSKGAQIIDMANQRSNKIVEEAKNQARSEAERLLQRAQNEIEQEYHSAQEKLMTQVAQLATAGAEKILKREINAANNAELMKEISGEL